MGSNTGTLIKPDMLRERVLPYHKRMAEIAREAGKIFVLHSCGNLTAIMDDLIDEVGIDGKHSFQDAIMPVEEVYQRWGDRISVLGGVDMDLLGRGTQEQVRERVRRILDACAASGTGYCLGSGNSIPDYIPLQNYLAMLDEGRRWNREHFGAP
jgi:uroporphyrinogen decarboxylase